MNKAQFKTRVTITYYYNYNIKQQDKEGVINEK